MLKSYGRSLLLPGYLTPAVEMFKVVPEKKLYSIDTSSPSVKCPRAALETGRLSLWDVLALGNTHLSRLCFVFHPFRVSRADSAETSTKLRCSRSTRRLPKAVPQWQLCAAFGF